MKRIIAISFFLIYVATAFGIGIDIHYCKGKISTISVIGLGNGTCGCKGKMGKDCCKDEVHFYKADNHKTQNIASPVISLEIVKPHLYSIDYNVPLPSAVVDKNKLPDNNEITLRYSNSLFILHHVFRV